MSTKYGNNSNNNITANRDRSSSLYGSGGNDTLTAYDGASNTLLDGGSGDDRLYAGRQGFNNLIGGSGNDRLYLSGRGIADAGTGNDIITQKNTSETLGGYTVSLGDGDDQISINNAQYTRVYGGNGRDNIRLGRSAVAEALGGTGDDLIDARSAGSTGILWGEDGNDAIYGSGNSDLDVNGGYGNDLLSTGSGSDDLVGYSGFDILQGSKVDSTTVNEIDELTGDAFGVSASPNYFIGNDTFVLGDGSGTHYDDALTGHGYTNYADIRDYQVGKYNQGVQDIIQLSATDRDLYYIDDALVIQTYGVDTAGQPTPYYTDGATGQPYYNNSVAIYKGDPITDGNAEFIGLMKGVSIYDVSLDNSSQFSFA